MNKLILDRPRCEGHGLCEEVAAQLLHIDDEGYAAIDVDEINDANLAAAQAAARVCPVAALRLVEIKST
ncbi:putative Fe-S, FMN containing oxidoreductase [Paraburkholderia tropica]|uniref:ferredoxin n=1 Tax=Paraburkholderia tropica TaxID=92647 RepID=UPI001CABFDAA|nr:ferredoxin [Paraburkholderia tropica]CAG9221875.1 putative Fe-S, FMN containing oxidoreductase [Paraburkholderia tropica]